MRLTFTKAEYLGHQNLKNALESITKIGNNRALTATVMNDNGTTDEYFQTNAFEYKIGDTIYAKAAGTHDFDVATDSLTLAVGLYAVLMVLIDTAGTLTYVKGSDVATKSLAILDIENLTVSSTKAIMGFIILGDGTLSFNAGSDKAEAGTNMDFYSVGATAVSSGLGTDGDKLIPGL